MSDSEDTRPEKPTIFRQAKPLPEFSTLDDYSLISNTEPLVEELQLWLGAETTAQVEKQELRNAFSTLQSVDEKVKSAMAAFPEADEADAVLLFGHFPEVYSEVQRSITRVWLAYISKLWDATPGYSELDRDSNFVIRIQKSSAPSSYDIMWDCSFNKVLPLCDEMSCLRQESNKLTKEANPSCSLDEKVDETHVNKMIDRAESCSTLTGKGNTKVHCNWTKLLQAVVSENTFARRWFNYKVQANKQESKRPWTSRSNLEAKDLYWSKQWRGESP